LYVSYQGHQTPETLKACLDDMAAQLDTVTFPVMILINWLEVTESEPKVLQSQHGHRAYSHPMAARGILVGFSSVEKYFNQTTAASTRGYSNTQYFDTIEQAMDYLQPVLTAS
jgi:hypothetical protein